MGRSQKLTQKGVSIKEGGADEVFRVLGGRDGRLKGFREKTSGLKEEHHGS